MTSTRFAFLAITRSSFNAMISKKAGLRSGETEHGHGFAFGTNFNAVYELAAQGDDMVVLRVDTVCAVEARVGFVDLEIASIGAGREATYEYFAKAQGGNGRFTVQPHAIAFIDRTMRDFARLSDAFQFTARPIEAPKQARSPRQLAAIRASYARKRALAA